MAIIATAGVSASTPTAQEQRDENAAYLPELTRECERLGLDLHITDDPAIDLPEVKTINGVRTCIAKTDELGVALDDLRAVSTGCLNCHGSVDLADPSTIYADGYNDIFGTPLRICRACRAEQNRLANEPDRLAFSRALDAIEATFRTSKNPEQTRNALRTFVDMTADEARK